MFSFFKNGIKQINPNKVIDLASLAKHIKNNPQKDLIEKIRSLRKLQDQAYKKLKEQLSYITPSCMLKTRKLEAATFNNNFNKISSITSVIKLFHLFYEFIVILLVLCFLDCFAKFQEKLMHFF